jgi:GPI mannosyltransferase 4
MNYIVLLAGDHDSIMVYLVTPPFALRSLDRGFANCFMDDKRMFPHLDLDHISESVEMGWREGLSLGIYVGGIECLKKLGDQRF